MRALVIVPTFNEADNLAMIVERVLAVPAGVDILVVDDDSPDGTGDIADQLADGDTRVHVLHHGPKRGLGVAYRAGFAWGLARSYDTFVELDADGSHRPEELGRLLTAADGGADLVLGSRWVRGGSVLNWPWYRRLISRGGTLYARLVLGLPVKDATGGYRVFPRATLERLRLDEVASQGYCFQIDMVRRASAAGLTVLEVPITFVEREHGRSKMTGGIVLEAFWRVTVWGVGRLIGRGPNQ